MGSGRNRRGLALVVGVVLAACSSPAPESPSPEPFPQQPGVPPASEVWPTPDVWPKVNYVEDLVYMLTARLAEDDAVTVGWSFSDAMAAWDPVM
ncbi:MAG: hypothetical protein U0904_03525 [Candidatus Nanopelagicales bacterium]|nr:hypothetical protein [Candidatus Nanopelagicales bacterium]